MYIAMQVFSVVTASLNPLVLDAKSQDIPTILDRLKTEADVSFEGEGRNFTISGSLKQINSCYRLLLSLLTEEQEISDKMTSCTFEDVDELAVQRVIGEALSTEEKKNAPETIGTIVARPMEDRPSSKVRYLGNVGQEGTDRIMYPPMADKQTFKAKSLAISYIRQRYSAPLQNIQEACAVEFDGKGSDTEVTLKPKPECDPSQYIDACHKFLKLLQSASQGMVSWELNSKCEKKEAIVSMIRQLLTNFPVILDQCKDNGAMVVYGDAASVEQVKLHLKEALNEPSGDDPSSFALAAAQFMDPVESSSLSIEMFSHRTKDGINISLRYGDITSEDVDAIVNPANDLLMHGLGLAKSIVHKGGYEIISESRKLMIERCHKPLEVGEAVYTTAGDLPCKFVIHAVGPERHKQSEKTTLQLLGKACFESLCLASVLQLSSVALPAISSGVFGVPIKVCAFAMLEGIKDFLAYLKQLNEQNKKEGAKTKQSRGNSQKKKIDKTHEIKHPESQAKNEFAQTLKREKQKPRLNDIRVVLIDADAMDFFLKEFTARFGSDQTNFVSSVEDDQVV